MSEKETEPEEDEECVTMCCHDGGHHVVTHGMGKKIYVTTLGQGLDGRENVVMTRLNDDDLAKIDALVEVEVFKSRSEATAFFIKEGINARKDLFEKVMKTVDQIKELKEKAKESLGKS